MDIKLSPKQQEALDGILSAWPVANSIMLWGSDGLGKTTILRALHSRVGGRLITIGEVVDAVKDGHPMGLEEAFYSLVSLALEEEHVVLVDDLHLLTAVCGGHCHMYPRGGWIEAPLTALTSLAAENGQKLVFVCGGGGAPESGGARA